VIRDTGVVLVLVLTLSCWFAGWPAGVPAWLPLLAALALVLVPRPRSRARARRWPRPHAETVLCLALALAYRASALVHPWGWVNRDGAYGAFVALHLLQGERPAPVFTEGANYQGTLKGHMAALLALLTGDRDFSRLIAAAGVLLALVFIAATMALARRAAAPHGRAAALFCGLYLAIGPRFPTVLTLNSVGQYADVLALGGLALALLARVLQEDARGRPARAAYFAIGLLLGAAFWQQPVALSYAIASAVVLLLAARTRRDPWALAALAGAAVGALPVLIWNLRNGWQSGEIMGRDPADVMAQAEALPATIARTFSVSFPILSGLSPGHPLASLAPVAWLAALLIPAAFVAFVIVRRREMAAAWRAGGASPALIAPLLMLACLALFWSVASGRVHWRPRYLLPAYAATAVHVGVALAVLARRSRALAALALAPWLALNAAGYLPRLREARDAQAHNQALVRGVQRLAIRTGYADFSVAAPITMFTAERILVSPRLGPTPAYLSPSQEARVAALGPDAFLLRPRDDAAAFAAMLSGLGVGYRLDTEPVPVFHQLTRRVTIEEVLAAWGAPPPAEGGPE
jgi:4-amino-4-deoxy-L-arabinose transferase-like glycosyltransferase